MAIYNVNELLKYYWHSLRYEPTYEWSITKRKMEVTVHCLRTADETQNVLRRRYIHGMDIPSLTDNITPSFQMIADYRRYNPLHLPFKLFHFARHKIIYGLKTNSFENNEIYKTPDASTPARFAAKLFLSILPFCFELIGFGLSKITDNVYSLGKSFLNWVSKKNTFKSNAIVPSESIDKTNTHSTSRISLEMNKLPINTSKQISSSENKIVISEKNHSPTHSLHFFPPVNPKEITHPINSTENTKKLN
jgi:hypothetical protein